MHVWCMGEILPVDKQDVDEITRLLRDTLVFDEISIPLVYEKIWGDGDYQPELTLKYVEAGRIVGMIMGVKRDTRGYVKLIAVAPEYRNRGIGTQLLERVEHGLAGVAEIRVVGSPPNYLAPGVDPRYTEAYVFFKRHGYEVCGEACNMEVVLTPDVVRYDHILERLKTKNISVRRADRNISDTIREFIDRHFKGWWPEVEAGLSNHPATVFVAERDNQIVGFAAHKTNNKVLPWFGPMGVDSNLRGMGIGEALLRCTLADMYDMGYKKAIIAWVGPIEFYYRTVGAKVTRVFWLMCKRMDGRADA